MLGVGSLSLREHMLLAACWRLLSCWFGSRWRFCWATVLLVDVGNCVLCLPGCYAIQGYRTRRYNISSGCYTTLQYSIGILRRLLVRLPLGVG